MKRTFVCVTSAAVLLSMILPTAMASSSPNKWFKMSIIENGARISSPYGVVQSDGKSITTFAPLYYVNRALTQLGYDVSWDGGSKSLSIQTTQTSLDFSSIPSSTGNSYITVNGRLVTRLNTVVQRDPDSGVNAAYVPIAYLGTLFKVLGLSEKWDGTVHTWAITQPSTDSIGNTSTSTSTSSTPSSGNSASSSGVTVSSSMTPPSIAVSEKNASTNVSVTGAVSGAMVTLFDTSGNEVLSALANANGATTFYNVGAGTYYVTEQTNGLVSKKSNEVTVSDSAKIVVPTLYASSSNGIWYITVNNGSLNSAVTLYNTNGSVVTSAVTNQYGVADFYDVGIGSYYVIVKSGGSNIQSNAISVNQDATTTISSTSAASQPNLTLNDNSGVYSLTVSNVNPYATVTVYTSAGSTYATITANASGTATLSTIGAGTYYAIQTANGVQSAASNDVTVNQTLTIPTLSVFNNNGVYSLTVSNVSPYATVFVYTSTGSTYATLGANASGTATLNSIGAGTYYAIQTANGVRSTASSDVTVSSTLTTPTLSAYNYNGVYSLAINNVNPYATVTVYTSAGSTYATVTANSSGTATLSTVGAGTYYAIQTANGSQSAVSPTVTVQ